MYFKGIYPITSEKIYWIREATKKGIVSDVSTKYFLHIWSGAQAVIKLRPDFIAGPSAPQKINGRGGVIAIPFLPTTKVPTTLRLEEAGGGVKAFMALFCGFTGTSKSHIHDASTRPVLPVFFLQALKPKLHKQVI